MKKLLLVALTLFFATTCFAQTQKGYVKTKGRMVDGKLVPGEGLKGAVVAVKGRTPVLVNKDSGEFSFIMRDEQFSFDSVKKQGYQLVDADVCARSYKYSSNPIYFVMETPEQQLQDKLNAERKIRRNLQKQLQERENEIENLKAEQKLTDEEYRQALQKLYQDQESNEQLISDMAKRYSELDYDQLDEFYRQVSYFIENGELMKADSLLNTRGDVTQQIEEEKQKGQVIREQKRKIKKAEAVHAANVDELAKRCYSYYENFFAQHMNDTAAYYLELRASLDTTNIEWLIDAGNFVRDYISDYRLAIKIYNIGLNVAETHINVKDYSSLLNNLGEVYFYLSEYCCALDYYDKALQFKDDFTRYGNQEIEASIYNNIGLIYKNKGDFSSALDYYNKALLIRLVSYGESHHSVVTSYNNIGSLYCELGEYSKALEYQYKSLTLLMSQCAQDDPTIANIYNSIGYIYDNMGEKIKSIEYYNKALEIWLNVYNDNHPNIATSYNNIGSIYYDLEEYDKALESYNKALKIWGELYDETHNDIALLYNQMGLVYNDINQYDKALECHNNALSIWLKLFDESHPRVATSYNNLGLVYADLKNIDKALEYYNKALSIFIPIYGINDQRIASVYTNIGFMYYESGDYAKALENTNNALIILENIFGTDDPRTENLKYGVGIIKAKLVESQEK